MTWQAWVITAVAAVIVVFAAATARIAKAPAMIAVVAAVLALYSITAAALSRSVAPAEPSLTPPPPVDPVPRQPAVPSVRRPEPVSDATRAPALAVEHLTKRFGQRVAFEDVSFSVAAGEVFGFLGPNGAGKTTTVRTLGTLLTPSAGTATVVGLELTERNGQEIRQRISIMPESPGLYLRLSVRENLELFAGLFNVTNARTRIGEALDAVNMAARADDICANLSKGLRQRVGLARALLNDPDILFLDEPTSGLDPVATREVHDLIVGLRSRGVTVFLTTHRLEEAERLCDRVAILNTTLRMLGRPDELRAQLFSRSLVVITAAPLAEPGHTFDEVGGVQSWQLDDTGRYVLTVDDAKAVAPPLTRALVAAGADVQAVYETQHTLEDVYMELISDDVEARVR
ncbi:MAG: ABC transporter ATP-binding protein [Candidatus Dormibacteraeota bacterium]|nr:ABC transporter ATP-binding protein [Candidatus Dormibacteraeota bacterium]